MFMQIEKFLGYEVEKMPLPKGLGKAPEYKVTEHGNNNRRGNKRNGKYKGKGKFKKKGDKPKEPRK